MVCEFVVPIGTLPKLALVGVAVKVEPARPSPVTTIVAGEFVALLATFTVPLTLPAVFGANVTSIVAVCPGASVVPLPPPLVVIPAPLIVTPENVTLELPVFFSVTASVFELPTMSFPKLKLVGVAVSARVAVTPVPLTVNVNVNGVFPPLLNVVLAA